MLSGAVWTKMSTATLLPGDLQRVCELSARCDMSTWLSCQEAYGDLGGTLQGRQGICCELWFIPAVDSCQGGAVETT
jgi:hypothetical protein